MDMSRVSFGLRRLAQSWASDPDLIRAGKVTMKDLKREEMH